MNWLIGAIAAVLLFAMTRSTSSDSIPHSDAESSNKRVGYINGQPFELEVASIGNGKFLSVAAAAAFLRMDAAYFAATGKHFIVNSAFRTMAEQQYEYDTQGPTIAAVPGKSTHQQGRSVDISTGGLSYASAVYVWLFNNARNYGFRNDSSTEAWHWTYYA